MQSHCCWRLSGQLQVACGVVGMPKKQDVAACRQDSTPPVSAVLQAFRIGAGSNTNFECSIQYNNNLALVPQENLTQEEREERRLAAEMEMAVRLQREREEAEAARAEQLRKEVRGSAKSLAHGARLMCGWTVCLHADSRQRSLLQLRSLSLSEGSCWSPQHSKWHRTVCMQPESGMGTGRHCQPCLPGET